MPSEPRRHGGQLIGPGLSDRDIGRFESAAAPNRAFPEGVLDLADLRCDTFDEGGVVAGVLRSRNGRPLRGPGRFLDLPIPRGRGAGRREVLELDVPVAVLDLRARSAENYFHLHVDALASRWLVDQLVPPVPGVRWLIPVGDAPWQVEALALAGLGDSVLPLRSAGRILAPRFLVPVRGLGSRSVPDWTVTALRAGAGPAPDPDGSPRLLHVTRAGAPRRRVAGEEALARALESRGFSSDALDGMPVAEQRRRFAAADVIVAAHGAALTNLVWSRAGATVVELLPVARPNLVYRRLALQAGVRHVGIICPPKDGAIDSHGDMIADVPTVVRVVDDVLASPR